MKNITNDGDNQRRTQKEEEGKEKEERKKKKKKLAQHRVHSVHILIKIDRCADTPFT